jgi:hypothetical protein
LHDLLNELNSVQKGKRTEVYIPIDKEEFVQFILPKVENNNNAKE